MQFSATSARSIDLSSSPSRSTFDAKTQPSAIPAVSLTLILSHFTFGSPTSLVSNTSMGTPCLALFPILLPPGLSSRRAISFIFAMRGLLLGDDIVVQRAIYLLISHARKSPLDRLAIEIGRASWR